MRYRIIIALAVLLLFPLLATAQGAQLSLPSFAHLRDSAIDSIDITVGPLPLHFASWLMDEKDPDSEAAKLVLQGLKSVRVCNYKFAADSMYSKHDIDTVREQLSQPGWTPLMQMRDRQEAQSMDMYLAMERGKVTGFALVIAEPREFTIVNVVGSIDPQQLARLQKQLGLPDATAAQLQQSWAVER